MMPSHSVRFRERLTTALIEQRRPCNLQFNYQSIRILDDAPLPCIELTGGMKLTLLSPDNDKLTKLRGVWEEVCREEGLDSNEQIAAGPAIDHPDIEPFGGSTGTPWWPITFTRMG